MTPDQISKLPPDWVLITWLFCDLLWTVLAFGCTAYAVFWRGHSGWWFLFAVILCASSSLINVLKKRYGIAEEAE